MPTLGGLETCSSRFHLKDSTFPLSWLNPQHCVRIIPLCSFLIIFIPSSNRKHDPKWFLLICKTSLAPVNCVSLTFIFVSFFLPVPAFCLCDPVVLYFLVCSQGFRWRVRAASPSHRRGRDPSGTVTHLDTDTQEWRPRDQSLKKIPPHTHTREQNSREFRPAFLPPPTHFRATDWRLGITETRLYGPRSCLFYSSNTLGFIPDLREEGIKL